MDNIPLNYEQIKFVQTQLSILKNLQLDPSERKRIELIAASEREQKREQFQQQQKESIKYLVEHGVKERQIQTLKKHFSIKREHNKPAEPVEKWVVDAKFKIRLRVGGTIFTVSKVTLLSIPNTFFSKMFFNRNWKPGKDGIYFF